jgi:hypothetical protein
VSARTLADLARRLDPRAVRPVADATSLRRAVLPPATGVVTVPGEASPWEDAEMCDAIRVAAAALGTTADLHLADAECRWRRWGAPSRMTLLHDADGEEIGSIQLDGEVGNTRLIVKVVSRRRPKTDRTILDVAARPFGRVGRHQNRIEFTPVPDAFTARPCATPEQADDGPPVFDAPSLRRIANALHAVAQSVEDPRREETTDDHARRAERLCRTYGAIAAGEGVVNFRITGAMPGGAGPSATYQPWRPFETNPEDMGAMLTRAVRAEETAHGPMVPCVRVDRITQIYDEYRTVVISPRIRTGTTPTDPMEILKTLSEIAETLSDEAPDDGRPAAPPKTTA